MLRENSFNTSSSSVRPTLPLVSQGLGFAWARKIMHQLFSRIEDGELVLHEGQQSYRFGGLRQTGQALEAHVTVNDPKAFRYMVLNGILGAGEAYIEGLWQSDDLIAVVRVFTRNLAMMEQVDQHKPLRRWAKNLVQSFANRNTLNGSKRNIMAHYDLSNEFFERFLDNSMMYSAAIFPAEDATLEEASEYKLRHICERLQLGPDDHLLEIGTGWGALACYAAEHYGCKVTSTTISNAQLRRAKQRVQERGLGDKVTLLDRDYRLLEGQYDKLVSVEMIEAVGHEYFAEYFSMCSRLLKDDGLFLLQSITIADQRYDQAKNAMDFIKKYIFPGGCLPSNASISANIAADTDMQIVGMEDIGQHYAQTLQHWRQRFHADSERIAAMGFDAPFQRLWDYYLAYCEGGFRERVISTVQVLAAKPGCHAVPAIR